MGLIRCKWYDNEGEPIAGGCKFRARGSCTYVHPDEGDWKRAERRLFARQERAPWHAPHKPKEKRKDFDESSWESQRPRQTQKNSGWSVASENLKESVASSSSSWRGDLGSSASTSKGWGVASESRGEADGDGGWGAGGGGWGWGAWGSEKEKEGGDSDSNGWGAPVPGSTWDSQSVPQEKPPAVIPSRKPSFNAPQRSPNITTDPRPRPPAQTILDAGASLSTTSVEGTGKGKEKATQKPLNVAISEQTTARSTGVAPAPWAPLPISTQPKPSPTIPMGPPPVPPAKAMPPPPPLGLTAPKNDTDTLLSQAGALKRKSISEQLKGDPQKSILKLSPQDRIDRYRTVIKHIYQLVHIQICLKKAKATEENWRRNNSSDYYAKSTQVTRKKLEAGRREAADRTQDLRRQRAENIYDLLALPDIPSQSHRPYDPDRDRQKIMKYTLELGNWVKELDLPRRLAAYKQPLSKPSDTATENAAGPSPKGAIPSVVDQLDTGANISIEDLTAAVNALEARVINAEENIYMSAYTVSDVDDATRHFREGILTKRNAARLKRLSSNVTAQSQDAQSVDAALRQSLDEATIVNERIQSLHEALKDLKAKTESLNKSNEEAERMIQEAENKQEERSKLVKELSEQLATLALTRKSPRPVREVTIDDIAPEIQQEIVDQVKAQLRPVMEGIIAGARHAGEVLKGEVDKMASQVTERTAELTSTAESSEVRSAS